MLLLDNSQELFFELLLVATGAKSELSRSYSEKEWEGAYCLAEEQAITGIILFGIENLQSVHGSRFMANIPKELLLQWIGMAQMIEQNSKMLAEASKRVVKYFRDNGFACEILKGSAVARYYPEPLRRSSGDVDVWVDGSREKIYDFARKFDNDDKLYGVNYHHIHFHLIENVHTEVHIWPSFLSSPLRNKRLHQFCNLHRPTMDGDIPSLAFDRVFILLHCYRHICGDGVGLRQVMDYYYVLRQGFTEAERTDAVKWINKLGMGRFARGLMWVLREVFGLEEKYILMEPDEKEGQFILNEIMLTGNMGHSDSRSWGSKQSATSRFLLNLRRDLYMAGHYPHEALWQPLFSVWLYGWRMAKGLLADRED